jgi:hypothetical protein
VEVGALFAQSCLEEYNCACFAALPNPLSCGEWETLKLGVSLGKELRRAVVGKNTRRSFHLLVGATLTIGTAVIGSRLTSSLAGEQSLWSILVWMAAGIIVTFFYLRWQLRSQEEGTEAIKERVDQLEPELRKQVQASSYGARRQLIEAPLRELDLDITPRLGWVRDPRLVEPELVSERIAEDIVAAFESSKRRMLIVGEPGSGKTIAAYSLIEHLDKAEGAAGRVPLLVNLSAWEAQDDFEGFLVDYLCSPVGYQVRERALASAFIGSDRYALVLDGLDEMPAGLRQQFSERLDEFVRGLPGEVGVVVTCRTQEYEQLLAAHFTGLGLVQAVEILPLTSEQLDRALTGLAKFDKDWGAFLSRRHPTASQRARNVLSNPLFLNLAVAGRLRPRQLLECDQEQEIRELVLESYLHRTLADQREYEPEAARRHLTWIARFLNGDEVSPFGLETSDYTVFDLANLTPPDPPRRYRLFWAPVLGLLLGLVLGLGSSLGGGWQGLAPGLGLVEGLLSGLVLGLVFGLLWWPFKRSAVSSRLTLVWPSTRRQLLAFLRRAGRGLLFGLVLGMLLGLGFGLIMALDFPVGQVERLDMGMLLGRLFLGLIVGLGGALVFGLLLALRNGGWFVLLQKVAHRRLARAGNLPPRPYDFLEWGIERQVFRRVGGGVRFRHIFIQQHLVSASKGAV